MSQGRAQVFRARAANAAATNVSLQTVAKVCSLGAEIGAWRNNNAGSLRGLPEEIGHTGSGSTRFAVFRDEASRELTLRGLLSTRNASKARYGDQVLRAVVRERYYCVSSSHTGGIGVPWSTRIDQLTSWSRGLSSSARVG